MNLRELFCKHSWKVISHDKTTPHYVGSCATSGGNLPYNDIVQVVTTILECDKCGKIDKTVSGGRKLYA